MELHLAYWRTLAISVLSLVFLNFSSDGSEISSICGSCADGSPNQTHLELANERVRCLESRMYENALTGVLAELKQSTYIYVLYEEQVAHLADAIVGRVSALGFTSSLTSITDNEAAVFSSCCVSKMPEFDSLFVLVSTLTGALPVLTEARLRNLLGPLYSWLIITYNYSAPQLAGYDVIMEGDRVSFLSLNMETQNWTTNGYQNCEVSVEHAEITLHSFYNSSLSGIGHWDLDSGWTLNRSPLKPFTGFNGKVFKIATLPVDFISFRFEFNGTVIYKGFFIEMMEEMAKKLDFKIQIVEPPSGTWAEMVMMVVFRQVDLAIGPFTITAERKEYIDFMYPVLTEQLSLIMHVPSENPLASSTLVFEAMTYTVWIVFYFTLIFCSTILWTLVILAVSPGPKLQQALHCSIKENVKPQCWTDTRKYATQQSGDQNQRNDRSYKANKLSTWTKCVFYTFGAAYVQGGTLLHNTLSVRVFDIFIRAAILVTVAAYMGNLTAFLTVQKIKVPINTLEELVNQDMYKVGILGNSAHQDLFEDATSGILQQVWEKITEDPDNNLLPDIGSGLEKVSDPDSKFVYITEKTLSDIALRVDCNLGLGKEVFFPRSIAFPIQKGSPYTPVFNEIIMNMHEGGLISKWISRYLPDNTCDDMSTQTTATSLPLIALLGAFEIVLLGNLIAAMVFGAEKAVFRYKRNKVTPVVIKVQSKDL